MTRVLVVEDDAALNKSACSCLRLRISGEVDTMFSVIFPRMEA